HEYVPHSRQPDLHRHGLRSNSKFPFLIYLDVWERHISSVEDDSIREVALGGADTASRAQLVWQVRHLELTDAKVQDGLAVKANWGTIVNHLHATNRGYLRAKAKEPMEVDSEP